MPIKIMGPAGSRSAFDAALAAGADEIYMGLAGYGARQSAANFTCDEFCRAIDDAHRVGAAVNLTLNTLMAEAEVERVAPDLARLDAAGLDAVIVQDFGVADFLAENFPHLARHASTQMALANRTDVAWAEKNGFPRVVLPRELSFDEIAAIRETTSVELEVFASGALCLACSGKCYLSSFIGGRSGNRGSCAQPCRQHYRVTAIDGAALDGSALDTSKNAAAFESGYLLSLTDQLQGAEEIARLDKIGVGVIKIEGRMKSPPYVFEAVRYYRQMIDRLHGVSPEVSRKLFVLKGDDENQPIMENPKTDLAKIFDRGYGKGYVDEHDPPIRHTQYAATLGQKVGVVENGAIRLTDSIRYGDGVVWVDEKFERLGGGNVSHIDRLAIRSGERPTSVAEAFCGERVLLDSPPPAAAVALYRSFDYGVNKKIEHALANLRRHRPIQVSLTAHVGEPLALELSTDNITVLEESPSTLEKSLKRKATADELTASLDRFGETPLAPVNITLDFDEEVFVPKSLLNQTRQKAAETLQERLIAFGRRPLQTPGLFARTRPRLESLSVSTPARLSALVHNETQAAAALDAGVETVYRCVRPVCFEGDRSRLESQLQARYEQSAKTANGAASKAAGVSFAPLTGTILEADWFESRKIPFAADWFFNVANIRAATCLLTRFEFLSTLFLSPELSQGAATRLAAAICQRCKNRPVRVGLSIYGQLPGMTTRKTLFDSPRVELVNQDGRTFTVVKNALSVFDAQPIAQTTEPAALTGSTVYYGPVNDLRRSLDTLRKGGISELRFDFTDETPEQIADIIGAALDGKNLPAPQNAYGFSYPIF